MTSNAGAQRIIEPKHLGFGMQENAEEDYHKMKDGVMEEVKKIFKPEFINRIDEVIVFNSLKKDTVYEIVDKIISELNKRLEQNYLHVEITNEVKDKIVSDAYDERYGARPIRRYITKNIESLIAHKLIDANLNVGSTLVVDLDESGEFIINIK